MNIKKFYFSVILLFSVAFYASAHYMWLESPASGRIGKAQPVKVYFGEYTYGVIEDPDGEHFPAVANFKVWVITPSGQKQQVTTRKAANAYEGSFTPQEEGTYTVVLNNDEIEVIDYTQYDFGIFKTHYHSTAKVVVGKAVKATAAANSNGLTVVDLSPASPAKDGEVTLQVLYKGEPAKDLELIVYMKDLWSKKLTTDENGQVRFSLPWETKYTVEVTKKEEVPGTYNGKDYQFVWHCATYCLDLL